MEVGKKSKFKRAIRHMNPRHIVRSLFTRRTIQAITNKYGLVYFGKVDHTEDGVQIVRGHTVSPSQIDSHYSVGTIQGYDVTFVQRNSLTMMLNKTEQRCHWLIVSVHLKTKRTLPRLYVGATVDDSLFKASYTQLQPLFLGALAPYPAKFSGNFTVYGKPSDTLTIEHLISPSVGAVIADYFSALPFEIEDNVLYLYNENQHPTGDVLDKMFENGIWLAKTLDEVADTQDS